MVKANFRLQTSGRFNIVTLLEKRQSPLPGDPGAAVLAEEGAGKLAAASFRRLILELLTMLMGIFSG